MDVIVLVFIGMTCAYVAAQILNSKERNKVFNKRPIEVVDVKKYNRFCGILVICFGVAADLTLFICSLLGGVAAALSPLGLIAEAYVVLKVYSKQEIKMLKKR